ncbi:unnamed protein product [Caenorhabditis sp. 36 PRJEB53466]|nr:unnamed protein product [Caenorhabditis sp. 36 PRJEB53466]
MTSAKEQWRDAYQLAEQMYREEKPKKRTDIDMYSQLVCARHNSIFRYDPYTDTYSFRNQSLTFENPIPSLCRQIAEVDLSEMKRNTVMCDLDTPAYQNMTPLYVVPPSSILIFNLSQPRAFGLTDTLDQARNLLVSRPSEMDIQPGAEFLYKHKDHKVYRVIILSEISYSEPSDSRASDSERRYEVAFLDVCQVIQLKLKNLYMPIPELSLEKYPSALHVARLVGIKAFRPGFVDGFRDDLQTFYNDKARRKAGVSAMIYKTDAGERKLIVDYPALIKSRCTESEAVMAVHGHMSVAHGDPKPLTHQQIVDKKIVSLEYDSEDRETPDSDLLNDPSRTKPLGFGDCPFGTKQIDSFYARLTNVSPPLSAPSSSLVKPISQEPKEQPGAQMYLNPTEQSYPGQPIRPRADGYDPLNETFSSLRSSTLQQSCRTSAASTPQPTFDEQIRGKTTPTKQKKEEEQRKESSDGWGETPMKQKPPRMSIDDTDGWGLEEARIQEPKTGHKQRPLTAPKIPSTSDAWAGCSSALTAPKSVVFSSKQVIAVAAEIKEIPIEKSSFRDSPAVPVIQSEEEVYGKRIDTPAPRNPSEELPQIAVGIEKPSETEADDVFESEEQARDGIPIIQEERSAKTPTPGLPASSAVSAACLMSDAQANFHDDSDDAWANSTCDELKEEEEKLKRKLEELERQKQRILEEKRLKAEEKRQRELDEQKEKELQEQLQKEKEQAELTEKLREALKAHKGMKTEKLRERVREHFKGEKSEKKEGVELPVDGNNSVESVEEAAEGVEDERLSTLSNCPTELEEDRQTSVLLSDDEFAEVADSLKQLASRFVDNVQEAAFNKNRILFTANVFTLEMIAENSSGDMERRFWKKKMEEAKSLETSFD